MTTQIGQVYRHTRTGNLYIVVMLATDASRSSKFSSGPQSYVVIYRRHGATGAEGPHYARPEREFHEMGRWQADEEGDKFENLPRFQLQTKESP